MFSITDLSKHLGLYILNGTSPTPQVELKSGRQLEDPVNGNDMCHEVFIGNEGVRRHCEFKTFFSVVYLRYATPPRTTYPNWKVGPMLKHAMDVCKREMHIGNYISIDEQTLGFQGRHSDKLCVT